ACSFLTARTGLRPRDFSFKLLGDSALASLFRYVPSFTFELDRGRRDQFFQASATLAAATWLFVRKLLEDLQMSIAFLTTKFVNWHNLECNFSFDSRWKYTRALLRLTNRHQGRSAA